MPRHVLRGERGRACAGVALYGGDAVRRAVCIENGAEFRACEALLTGEI
jgi:hypothetical protein